MRCALPGTPEQNRTDPLEYRRKVSGVINKLGPVSQME